MINRQNFVIFALHATLANGKNPNETESDTCFSFSTLVKCEGIPRQLLPMFAMICITVSCLFHAIGEKAHNKIK